jgi:hypothetical protein
MSAIASIALQMRLVESDIDIVNTLALFCGAGLGLSVLLISCGLDLGAGPF